MYTYKYPHPAVTVDAVVFGLDGDELKVLLVKRKYDPFAGSWAIPGGFVNADEDIEDAARRELAEETAVTDLYLEQFAVFGKPDRDPRERVITIAFFAIVNLFEHPIRADSDAKEVDWFSAKALPDLAFDHREILSSALQRLQREIRYKPLVFSFIPEKFTLRQVQHVYELILCKTLDKRNFRKKILNTGLIVALREYELDVSHRAAQLYTFDRLKYQDLAQEGFEFGI